VRGGAGFTFQFLSHVRTLETRNAPTALSRAPSAGPPSTPPSESLFFLPSLPLFLLFSDTETAMVTVLLTVGLLSLLTLPPSPGMNTVTG